jgi:hypothetical protein
MRRLRSSLRGQGKWALLCSIAISLIAAPFAVAGDGDVMRVGARNSAETKETRIIGQDVSTYATRQSNNKSNDGGAATYGCRSILSEEPCINVFALRSARAFLFTSRGNEGGRIVVSGPGGPDANKPFTTNATGVATGLNADRVDGISGESIQSKTLIAAVSQAGALASKSRGVTTVSKLAGDGLYRITFVANIANCAYTATETTTSNAGAAAVRLVNDTTLEVRTRQGLDSGVADKAFNVVVTC